MKTLVKNTLTGLVLSFAVVVSTAAPAADSPGPSSPATEQAKKLERMTAQGPDASLTVLPVLLVGQPFDRVSEFVALRIEQQGLKTIELGATAFVPGEGTSMEKLPEAFANFVRQNPPMTEYVLYAEFNGNRQSGLNELRTIVVDKTGAILWTDHQTASDEAFRKAGARDPMAMAMLLVERLSPQLGLNTETAKAARPGKFARLMEERSGLPPQAERDVLPARQQAMIAASQNATVVVIPVVAPDRGENEVAARIAKSIGDARLFKSASNPTDPIALQPPRSDPNEMKMLWDLARQLREYVKKNPPSEDYVLCADYRFNAQAWERGYVHFVICDRQGEWVIVDLQNSHHPDYQSIKPASKDGCEKLLLKRLQGYLHTSEHPSGT
jgi:hypothetical protein